jgi:hypothetical protein
LRLPVVERLPQRQQPDHTATALDAQLLTATEQQRQSFKQ